MIDVWTKKAMDDKFNGEEILKGCMLFVRTDRKILAFVLWLNICVQCVCLCE